VIGEAISGLLNFNPARAAACRPSGAAPLQRSGLGVSNWLGNLDSNQDKQSQSLLCYRYTIPQSIVERVQWLRELFGNRGAGGKSPALAGRRSTRSLPRLASRK
jgi:hypothetical protein